MTYKEETYLLDSIERIERKVDENNRMLKSIIKVMNYYILNSSQENENDFARNIIANLVSNIIDFGKLKR